MIKLQFRSTIAGTVNSILWALPKLFPKTASHIDNHRIRFVNGAVKTAVNQKYRGKPHE